MGKSGFHMSGIDRTLFVISRAGLCGVLEALYSVLEHLSSVFRIDVIRIHAVS